MESRKQTLVIRRMGAFIIDILPIVIYIFITLAIGIGFVRGPLKDADPLDPVLSDLVAFITVILPVILYFAIQESSSRRATWGKRRLGLQVVTLDGTKLSFWQAFLRSALKFLPWQIAHTCIFHIPGWPSNPQEPEKWVVAGFVVAYLLLAITLLTLFLSKRQRTPYDRIAGTVVSRVDPGQS